MPVIASTATVASGNTPIRLGWTYNGLADKDKLKGNPTIEVVVRRRPLLGVYVPPQRRATPERRQALDGVPLLR